MMNRLYVIAGRVLILLLALQQGGCSDFFMDEQKTLQLARDYLQSEDINAAAIELRNTLQENPDNAEARYLLATIYLDFGDYATAEKEFRNARASGWDAAEATYGLLRSQLGLEDFNGVLQNTEANEAWPASVRAGLLSLRALAHAALGRRDEAFADLEAARELDAGSPDVLRTGIQLHIVAGDIEAATEGLRVALDRYPNEPVLLMLNAGLVSQDDHDAAEAAYRKVIAMDPEGFLSANGRNARLRLVQLQLLEQKFEAAEDTIRPMFSWNRQDPFTNYLGGVIAFQRGDYQRAEELLLRVLKVAPGHNPTRLLFGTVNFAEQNYEQAAYFLSKYVAAVPDNLVARKLLARSYILLGRNNDAGKVLQSVLATESDDAELLALVGMSELNMGRTAAGIAGLERAVEVEPDSMAMRIELARAYIEAGDTGSAINELKGMLAAGGEQSQTQTLLVLAHLRAGEYSQAVSMVLDIVAQKPQDPAVHTLAGTVFAASGDHAEARIYFIRARELQPGFPPATMSLANIEEQEGNLEQAKLLYRQLVDAGTESIMPMLALARVAEQQGDKAVLLGWLERASQHAPTDQRPHMLLAEYYLREGETAQARSYIRDALELSPGEPALLMLSARIFIAEENYLQALPPLQTLLKAEPASVAARILLGESYLQLGRFDDARSELLNALERNQGNVQVIALLAKLAINAGALDEALDYSQQIQQAYPELFLGFELAGDSLMASGKYNEAEGEYTQAWERMPSADIVIKRAENASRSSRTEAAVVLLEDWLQSHADDVQVAQFLGTTLQNAGKRAEAVSVYEKVIAADPDNVVALNNLAGLYLADNRPDALALAERAWQQAQDNPGVQDTYGWALVRNGQFGLGLRILEQTVKLLPDIPEVRYHHAVALYRAGNEADARKLLGELLGEGVQFEGRDDAEKLMQQP